LTGHCGKIEMNRSQGTLPEGQRPAERRLLLSLSMAWTMVPTPHLHSCMAGWARLRVRDQRVVPGEGT